MRQRSLWLLALIFAVACNTRPIFKPGESPIATPVDYFPQTLNNKADILFMIDNSNSMDKAQESLRQYFPNFIEPLKNLPTKPDLHIGVITSDLGAGQFTPPSCDTIGGDQGMLQNSPNGTTCSTAHLTNSAERFLTYAPDASGGAATNFTGDIADAFACYASVGVGGCGFEHVLASVQTALDGCASQGGCTQHQNVNFLRDDAYLAVIYLTNEDDCSAPRNSTLFDPGQTSLSSQLGPLTSYRCFEFGNLCNGADPGRGQGPRQDCVPGNKDQDPQHQLTKTKDFADALKALKPKDPRWVYVSVIAGPPAPVNIGLDASGYPDLQPSCTGLITDADPATRLTEFVSYFDDDRASFISICQSDLKQAMEKIADELGRILGTQCLPAPLKNTTPGAALTPDCQVTDRTAVDVAVGTYTYANVPACAEVVCDPATAPGGKCKCQTHAGASPNSPCWFVWPDTASCPLLDTDTPVQQAKSVGAGYQIWVDRGTDASCTTPQPPTGTDAVVQCSSCIVNPSKNSYDCTPGCKEHWPACCPDDGSAAPAGCYTP